MKIKEVKIESVIFVKYTKGDGTKKAPVRIVKQYWDLDGNLIAELDDYELIKDSASSEINS